MRISDVSVFMPRPKTSKFEDLDIPILEQLMIDCRKPFSEIARDLGVNHSTIINR
jgi:DNA-binding Lrp family transcriptional regulator